MRAGITMRSRRSRSEEGKGGEEGGGSTLWGTGGIRVRVPNLFSLKAPMGLLRSLNVAGFSKSKKNESSAENI
jgi:hypothetical protein